MVRRSRPPLLRSALHPATHDSFDALSKMCWWWAIGVKALPRRNCVTYLWLEENVPVWAPAPPVDAVAGLLAGVRRH